MKRTIVLLLLSVLGAGMGCALLAQDGPAPRVSGKVLILKNERAFEGEIEQAGESYRVRKGSSEMAVSADQALRLCADWDAALDFMRSRANLGDPDERLRLARWCQINHQIERARVEAKLALDMRPKHAETRRLVKVLELTTTGKARRPASAGAAQVPVPQIDLSFESVTAFSLRVQPILMNTCINCHSGNYQGKFRLYHLHEGGERVAMHRNIAAVMAQVHLENPAASPLLIRAVNAHGNAKTSPISGRQAPTFQTLCFWIDQTLADNPQLLEKTGRKPAPISGSTAFSNAPVVSAPSAPPVADKVSVQPPPAAAPKAAPAPQVEAPLDEFSAAHFNGWAHPAKK